jgi:hypothetical protein
MFKYILIFSLLFFAQSSRLEEIMMMFLKMVKKNPVVASSILKSAYEPLKDMMTKEVGDNPILKEYITMVEDLFTKHPDYIDEACKMLYKNAFIIDNFERIDRMNTKQIIWFINQMARGDGVKDFVLKMLDQYPNLILAYMNAIVVDKEDVELKETYEYVKAHHEVYKDLIEIFEFLNERTKAIELIEKFREKGIPMLLLKLTNLIEEVIS